MYVNLVAPYAHNYSYRNNTTVGVRMKLKTTKEKKKPKQINFTNFSPLLKAQETKAPLL